MTYVTSRSLTSAASGSIKSQNQRTDFIDPRTQHYDKSLVSIKNFFLPYQWDYINDPEPFIVCEKGRRVGISEAQAYRSNLNCMLDKLDTVYSSYNLPATKTFIKKCAKWARAFNRLSQLMYKRSIIDESKITTYRIEYLNGRVIEAIPSNAQNFRDRDRCEIIRDEAAFGLHFQESLDAMRAVSIWGYPIKIISTHYGESNAFNKLVEQLKANPKLGKVLRVSFYDAVAAGLYKKICEVQNKQWTPTAEKIFINYWTDFYGSAAPQELGAIALKGGHGKIFSKSDFHYESYDSDQIATATKIRSYDLAATAKIDAKEGHYYTASTLLALIDDKTVILDCQAKQLSADKVEEWIIELAELDDDLTFTLIEQEPGSHSSGYINHLQRRISNRNIVGIAPHRSKVQRALPLVPALKHSDLVLLAENKEQLEEWLVTPMTKFDGSKQPLTNDVTDTLSQGFNYISENLADWVSQ